MMRIPVGYRKFIVHDNSQHHFVAVIWRRIEDDDEPKGEDYEDDVDRNIMASYDAYLWSRKVRYRYKKKKVMVMDGILSENRISDLYYDIISNVGYAR